MNRSRIIQRKQEFIRERRKRRRKLARLFIIIDVIIMLIVFAVLKNKSKFFYNHKEEDIRVSIKEYKNIDVLFKFYKNYVEVAIKNKMNISTRGYVVLERDDRSFHKDFSLPPKGYRVILRFKKSKKFCLKYNVFDIKDRFCADY